MARRSGKRLSCISWRRSPRRSNNCKSRRTATRSPPLTLLKTATAPWCQRAICRTIRDGGGDYLFAVKANQPNLRPMPSPSANFPPCCCGLELEAHRLTTDLLALSRPSRKAMGASRCGRSSHECVAISIAPWHRSAGSRFRQQGGKRSREIHAITSLTPDQAGPDGLRRDHWLIENVSTGAADPARGSEPGAPAGHGCPAKRRHAPYPKNQKPPRSNQGDLRRKPNRRHPRRTSGLSLNDPDTRQDWSRTICRVLEPRNRRRPEVRMGGSLTRSGCIERVGRAISTESDTPV